MRSLHNAGHEITFVSPFPNDESLKNYSVIDTKRDTPIYVGKSSMSQFRDMNIFKLTSLILETETKYCKDVLGSSEIQVCYSFIKSHTWLNELFLFKKKKHDSLS